MIRKIVMTVSIILASFLVAYMHFRQDNSKMITEGMKEATLLLVDSAPEGANYAHGVNKAYTDNFNDVTDEYLEEMDKIIAIVEDYFAPDSVFIYNFCYFSGKGYGNLTCDVQITEDEIYFTVLLEDYEIISAVRIRREAIFPVEIPLE